MHAYIVQKAMRVRMRWETHLCVRVVAARRLVLVRAHALLDAHLHALHQEVTLGDLFLQQLVVVEFAHRVEHAHVRADACRHRAWQTQTTLWGHDINSRMTVNRIVHVALYSCSLALHIHIPHNDHVSTQNTNIRTTYSTFIAKITLHAHVQTCAIKFC